MRARWVFGLACLLFTLVTGLYFGRTPSLEVQRAEQPLSEAVPAEQQQATAFDSGSVATAILPVTGPLRTTSDYPLDLDALRRKLPENLYFVQDSPTTDDAELERRHQERVRWNERFGRVQSGEATEEEIAAYFDHQERVSHDYIQFCEAALEMGQSTLPERDRGLFEYGIVLHTQKLKDLPGQRAAAIARREEQLERLRVWRDRR